MVKTVNKLNKCDVVRNGYDSFCCRMNTNKCINRLDWSMLTEENTVLLWEYIKRHNDKRFVFVCNGRKDADKFDKFNGIVGMTYSQISRRGVSELNKYADKDTIFIFENAEKIVTSRLHAFVKNFATRVSREGSTIFYYTDRTKYNDDIEASLTSFKCDIVPEENYPNHFICVARSDFGREDEICGMRLWRIDHYPELIENTLAYAESLGIITNLYDALKSINNTDKKLYKFIIVTSEYYCRKPSGAFKGLLTNMDLHKYFPDYRIRVKSLYEMSDKEALDEIRGIYYCDYAKEIRFFVLENTKELELGKSDIDGIILLRKGYTYHSNFITNTIRDNNDRKLLLIEALDNYDDFDKCAAKSDDIQEKLQLLPDMTYKVPEPIISDRHKEFSKDHCNMSYSDLRSYRSKKGLYNKVLDKYTTSNCNILSEFKDADPVAVYYALRRANAFKECDSPDNIPLGILNKHYGILSLAWIDWYKSKNKHVKCK